MLVSHKRAIVLLRSRPATRRLCRILVGAGYAVEHCEDESAAPSLIERAGHVLVVGEPEVAVSALSAANLGPASRVGAVLCHPENFQISDLLDVPLAHAFLSGALDGSGPAIAGGLMAAALRFRGKALPPMQAHLQWGALAFHTDIATVEGREAAVARIVELCADQLSVPRRIVDHAGEVAHELITNAMYDAPVDPEGNLRYARDRSVPIALAAEDQVSFRYGTDGLRLAIEVSDRFGRLRRSDLGQSLRRGRRGEIRMGEGGAGIGLSRVFRVCQTLQVDVEPGRRTRVTAVLELEPARAGEAAHGPARSLIFPPEPSEEMAPAGTRADAGRAP